MSYWSDRDERERDAIAAKTEEEVSEQLRKYYADAMQRTIREFEITFNNLLAAIEDGREPTPADLYKLDQYWRMQSQLKAEAQKLGDKMVEALSRAFEEEWRAIYEGIALPSDLAFSTSSLDNAKAMIQTAWLSDGKTFSARVWENIESLVDTLNEELTHCVVTGKRTRELKDLLQARFGVSYNRAETLVRTESARIKTEAAAQRYKDLGLTRYKFLGRGEEKGCGHKPDCHELNGKIFLFSEMQAGKNAPPMHPRCRCAIKPIVE